MSGSVVKACTFLGTELRGVGWWDGEFPNYSFGRNSWVGKEITKEIPARLV